MTTLDTKAIKAVFLKATDEGKSFDDALAAAAFSIINRIPKRDDGAPDAVNWAYLNELALHAAVHCKERHSYMPSSLCSLREWSPHDWVLDAMRAAVHFDRRMNGRS